MLFLLSPAKTLDYDSSALSDSFTMPRLIPESQKLIKVLRKLDSGDVSKLMNVSEKIADLNVQRFADWSSEFTQQNSKQAVFAFKGDVYTGLAIETADQEQIDYIQSKVRILSGLYGLLKPLDLMQAYRLEMGTKLDNDAGKNLYAFWGDEITKLINEDLSTGDEIETSKEVVINLASNEYFKAVKTKLLNADIITPVFKDKKNDQYKIISFYAKKARGLMVRYAADKNIQDPEQLKAFDYEGYQYNQDLSTDREWVFTRDSAPGATK